MRLHVSISLEVIEQTVKIIAGTNPAITLVPAVNDADTVLTDSETTALELLQDYEALKVVVTSILPREGKRRQVAVTSLMRFHPGRVEHVSMFKSGEVENELVKFLQEAQ